MRVVRSTRVVLPGGEAPASILVEHGRIVAIEPAVNDGASSRHASGAGERWPVDDFGDLVILPGLVDTHVHVNEPGRTEWEGFDTATRAGAAGGVTTVVDMPLNSIPATTTVDALEEKRRAARGRVHVDVAFWGGVVPGNADEIEPLVDAGVRGFKCFLVPSGVDEFQPVDERDLRRVLPILARRGVPLLVHAEDREVIERSAEASRSVEASRSGTQAYAAYLRTRPPEAEVAAVETMIRLARESGASVHVVHVACAEAVDAIARAQAEGVPITAETCPHYLTFAAEEIPDGRTEFKCAPPIRGAVHRDALWRAVETGTLGLIATDHSPAPPSMKCGGDFMKAWGGIPSIELSLAAVWTSAGVQGAARGVNPCVADLARWMSEAPARLAGLAATKGRIAPGCDADLVVWDPDEAFTVDPASLQQRHKLSPYAGRRLRGRVHTTFVRGIPVWHAGALVTAGEGRLL